MMRFHSLTSIICPRSINGLTAAAVGAVDDDGAGGSCVILLAGESAAVSNDVILVLGVSISSNTLFVNVRICAVLALYNLHFKLSLSLSPAL